MILLSCLCFILAYHEVNAFVRRSQLIYTLKKAVNVANQEVSTGVITLMDYLNTENASEFMKALAFTNQKLAGMMNLRLFLHIVLSLLSHHFF